MKVPQLKKKLEIKSCHNIEWEDNYSWIHQKNILDVLKDKTKLDPEACGQARIAVRKEIQGQYLIHISAHTRQAEI